MTFAEEWFELEMAAYMNNGAVETVKLIRAPGVFVQRNTAAPPLSLGFDIVQPST